MSKFLKYSDRACNVAILLSFGAALVAAMLTVVDIVLRLCSWGYTAVSGSRVAWAVPGLVDLNQLAIMTCASFGIAVAFFRASHVGVDFVTSSLPNSAQKILTPVAGGLGVLFALAAVWAATGEALGQLSFPTRSATLNIPFIWYWVPLIMGLGLSIWGVMAAVVRVISDRAPQANVPHE